MSPMSERRETTLNESPFALSPSTKRETFHWPKYSLIVGTITTTEVNASEAVGVQAFAERSSRPAWRTNSSADALKTFASGSTSPNSSRPSPSRSAFAPTYSGRVPQSMPSVRLKRLPGLLRTVPVGSLRSNGTALAGSSFADEPASRITS